MQEPGEDERLRRLSQRLAELKRETDPDAPRTDEHHTQAQVAWRMVTELVAGLLVGFAIGYGLDVLFGTRPWLLVAFTLLGFAAGVQTMLRTARELQGRAAQGHGTGADAAPEKNGPGRRSGEGQEEDRRRG